MHSRPKPSALVFAKDVLKLATFYKHVLAMAEVEKGKDHVVLEADGLQLVIHGIPKRIAASIQITNPPQVREDTPIKICFPVDTIEQARSKAMELGGQVGSNDKEWEARGFRACDGHDPEGNVFQLRESAA
jgi:predicted enzyme related to lactoylglutathione lyase